MQVRPPAPAGSEELQCPELPEPTAIEGESRYSGSEQEEACKRDNKDTAAPIEQPSVKGPEEPFYVEEARMAQNFSGVRINRDLSRFTSGYGHER